MHRLHCPSPVTAGLTTVQSPSVSATTAVLCAVAGEYQLGGNVVCNLQLTRAFSFAMKRLHLLAPVVALAVSSGPCCSSGSTFWPLI